MLNASKAKPSPPKYNYIKGFTGLVLIAAGYIVALNFKQWDLDLLLSAMGILILVSTGTYLLFWKFSDYNFREVNKFKKNYL